MKILYSLFPRAPGGEGNVCDPSMRSSWILFTDWRGIKEEYGISKMSPLKAALAAKNYGVDSAAIQERNVVLESLTKMITVADNADTQRLREKDKENADKRRLLEAITVSWRF
jgi:IS4 transposase